MKTSFIITSYNIENYIIQCLESVAKCARAGDEIILVDDGSNDDTLQRVQGFIQGDTLPADVTLIPIFLGANTFGGVGIAANIGMDHARKDIVFFVDGDDWVNPETFNQSRDLFAARGDDFMILNYLQVDDQSGHSHPPADQERWDKIQKGLSPHARQELALSFIAVPWRKFYRRRFLRANGLRFPEGDFFFEDNPFHWEVCRASPRFSFSNQVICYHRVNRPGQTMASTGGELLAFFTHYETIRRDLYTDALRVAALRWLISNMSWHLDRLHPNTKRLWAERATGYLQEFAQDIWHTEIQPHFEGTPIGDACAYLRADDVAGFLADQRLIGLDRKIDVLRDDIRELHQRVNHIQDTANASLRTAETTRNIQEYSALVALHKAGSP